MAPEGFVLAARPEGDFALSGRLVLDEGERLWETLVRSVPPQGRTARVDLSGVEALEGGAAALLLAARGAWRAEGGELEFVGAAEPVARVLELYGCPGEVRCLREEPRRVGLLESVGASTVAFVEGLQWVLAFVGDLATATVAAVRDPRSVHWRSVGHLMERAGADGVPVIALINFLVGLIMALQAAAQLERFGAQRFVAALVGLSMTRELAPLMTAIVVAGRSGAAYAAELGTMKVSEEVDALRTLGLDPQRYLVFPRVIAMVLVVPLLTLVADAVAILGGLFVGTVRLQLVPEVYWNAFAEAVDTTDVVVGVVKSAFFAATITFIACQRGLATRGGAQGVGRSTTSTVVTILFALIVLDAGFTILFEALGL